MGLRPKGGTFGGAQLPRIADDALLELCLGTLPDDPEFNEIVEALGRIKNGAALTVEERDRWIHMAQKAGLLKKHRPAPKGPPKPHAHDPDGFSAVCSDGTLKAEAHLASWARPGGRMPMPPNRRGA
jgi:hypothetical protein